MFWGNLQESALRVQQNHIAIVVLADGVIPKRAVLSESRDLSSCDDFALHRLKHGESAFSFVATSGYYVPPTKK
jgi:hypothetical protein